jgi:hypothetical protein
MVLEFALNFDNRPVYIEWLGFIPMRADGIEGNQVPKRSRVPATDGLLCPELVAQFSSDQMVLVPELNDSGVRNSSQYRTSWSTPIGR